MSLVGRRWIAGTRKLYGNQTLLRYEDVRFHPSFGAMAKLELCQETVERNLLCLKLSDIANAMFAILASISNC